MTNTHALALSHNEALQLLPWHVQGTLANDEAAQVTAHVEDCEECHREMQALRSVFGATQTASGDVDEQRLGKLMQRIDTHEAANSAGDSLSLAARLRQQMGQWFAPRWALPVGGTLAAGLALMMWLPQSAPPDAQYEVHSSVESAAPALRIIFTDTAGADRRDLFGAHAQIVGSTPESTTQFLVQVRPNLSVAELSTLIGELERRPDIASVSIANEQ